MNNNASFIFPIIQPLPEVLGEPRLREDVLKQLRQNAAAYETFQKLPQQNQEAFLEFCMGNRGLKITYDPFFKHIFNPDTHPERLDGLLSAILKQKVRVKKVLPRQRDRTSEEGSLIIMDILVELSDKSLINVEMQRIGYDFPGERCFCYGADLLVRQYDLVRAEKGEQFSYRNIHPVYVIVLMESSPHAFQKHPDKYIHHSDTCFDTGLKIKNLLNFVYIPLDIFRKMPHNELTELDAWLYFLGSDDPQDILRITEKYPLFRELYREITRFRYHPKELITMYSDALQIMDRNTERYMIDKLKRQYEKQKAQYEKEMAQYEQQKAQYEQQKVQYEQQKVQYEQQKVQYEQQKAQYEKEMAQYDSIISQKDAENQRLREELARYKNAEGSK